MTSTSLANYASLLSTSYHLAVLGLGRVSLNVSELKLYVEGLVLWCYRTSSTRVTVAYPDRALTYAPVTHRPGPILTQIK